VASCAVELVQVIARRDDVPLTTVQASIAGELEPDNPVRPDLALFNRVRLDFRLGGVTGEQADALVDGFKRT
jgi:hypothetical protein